MADLVRLVGAELAYGTTPLLDQADFKIEDGERVCIVGRNGAGKSTLMQVVEGTVLLDSGEINRHGGIQIARLEQDPPKHIEATVFDYIAEGLGDVAQLLKDYHKASHDVAQSPTDTNLKKLDYVCKSQSGSY